MADAREHAAVVLSAILSTDPERFAKAARVLVPEHFEDNYHRGLFKFISDYYERTGGIAPLQAVEDLTRNSDPGRAQIFVETYQGLVATTVSDEEFRWSIDQLRELYSERMTKEALSEAMEVLTRGIEENGETVKGAEEARIRLSLSLGQIDRDMTLQAAPEGNVRTESLQTLAEYAKRKAERESGHVAGILFGIPGIDQRLNGLRRGEVALLAAASGDGKTSLLVQLAWHAAVVQGKNVVFYTTETIREQVKDRLISRHSMLDKFGLAPAGINSADIRNGSIHPDREQAFADVVTDFENGEGYGTLWVKQVPRGAGFTYVEQSLASLGRRFEVDLVCMDYFALLAPERKRQSTREELAQIMKDAKGVATSFNGGQGVPLVSPWQVTREAREKAADLGMYSDASLSETAESVNSADVLVSMYAPRDNTEQITRLHMQILKNRSGPSAKDIDVQVDYGTSTFKDSATAATTTLLQPIPGSRSGQAQDPIAALFD